ncbi:hypothetical protein NEK97_06755 [Paenarthrobacter sp. UW852]|uniref:sunset domain-containing protein n=1 Tax=Paenarthrobacter sp. UW852 TaxID=2951989 RepID=UPI00214942CF|nr:hypothetical protein [Paenarthrobacter sp. UW852]MCR1161154.1 hypothetical protein [Paenarthrobacter sp. UW852]
MDWLIWVIVIVLVVAIIWWLMSRNKAPDSTPTRTGATTAPAAMEPGNRGAIPDTAAAAAGVAGLAGVTNLGTTAAEGSGPTREERTAEEPDVVAEPDVMAEPEVAEEAVVVEDSSSAGSSDIQQDQTPGLTVEEPVVAAPVVDEPTVSEPKVDIEPSVDIEPVVDTDVQVDRDAVVDTDAAVNTDPAVDPSVAGGSHADKEADKAEWESSWTDESGAPVHHHEYTDSHSPTLPGAESAAAEEAVPSGHLAVEHPYGTGSSSSPGDGHPVKASASAMTYHDEDTAGYEDVAADVWFESAAHAEAAGFRPPRRSRH